MNPEDLQKLFDKCPDEEFLNDIVHVSWSRAGTGFGEFYIWQDENGFHADAEGMGREFVRTIMNNIIDKTEFKS